MKKYITHVILGVLIGSFIFFGYQLHEFNVKNEMLIETYEGYKTQLIKTEIKVRQTEQKIRETQQKVDYFMDALGIEQMSVSGYAPLDPNAIEGVCYSGDPNVTASGQKPIAGMTVAAGPGIPFGTRVYIENIGARTVNDRGGAITNNRIDVVFATKNEAMKHGIRNLNVLTVKQ